MKNLFISPKYRKKTLIMLTQFSCTSIIYYLVLFNSAKLQGNILTIGIFFGLSEVIGIFLGEKVTLWFHPVKGTFISIVFISIISLFIKLFDITEGQLYLLFLLEVICIGILYNMCFILQDILITDPKLKSISFEFNFCFSLFVSMCAPQLAAMIEPLPTATIWLLGFIQILSANKISFKPTH